MSVKEDLLREALAGQARLIAAIESLDSPAAPAAPAAPPAPPAEEREEEFVDWLRRTAPARHARKARNRGELAPMLDVKRPGWRGASNRDAIWAAAKNGKRLPKVVA